MIPPKEAKKIKKYLASNNIRHLNLTEEINVAVVIPVFKDFMVFSAIESLKNSYSNIRNSKIKPALVVVINHPENSDKATVQKNKHIAQMLKNLSAPFPIELIEAYDLPLKYAGVGLARKIGMDAISAHFFKNNIENGVIISLDADTVVAENYFEAVFNEFDSNQKSNGVSIYYEHLPAKNKKIYLAITLYELHLRYYINMLRKIDFPFAFHTIGSAFAINYRAYLRQNGMPKKQGGEDFYLLNKIMLEGKYKDLTGTAVYPFARPTQKTPFGTGKTIISIICSGSNTFYTYNPQAFYLLKQITSNLKILYDNNCQNYINSLPAKTTNFLDTINFCDNINKIKRNTTNLDSFHKAFFTWFNGFKAVKFLNYLHNEKHLPKIPVTEAIKQLSKSKNTTATPLQLLNELRQIDQNNSLTLTNKLGLVKNDR